MPYDRGMKQKLTDKGVKNLKPNPAKRFDVRDTVLQGFILRVSPTGTKTFCLLKRVNRVVRRQTLGHYPIMSLAEARERCRQLLYEIETGDFEIKTGVEIVKKPSLGEIIPEYIEKHAKARNKDWKRKAALLRKFVSLHSKRIDKITRGDVVKACDDIHMYAPVSANRSLAHLKHLMSWCVDRGIIETSPIVGLKPLAKEKPRERVLCDQELTFLWSACADEGYPFGDCLKILILTGQRRAEVAEMRWSEIDLENRIWILPSERAKNGRQHTIPLSDTVIDNLTSLPRFLGSDFVFTTTGRSPISGFGRVKKRLDQTMPASTVPWTIHDIRRTMSTNLAKMGVPQPVTEAILNHKTGVVSGVAAIYNVYSYSEEKREALNAWSKRLHEVVNSTEPHGRIGPDLPVVRLHSLKA